MTAAESLERAERRASALRSSRSVARAIGVLLIVAFAYWRGRVDATPARLPVSAQRDTIVRAITVVQERVRVDTVRVRIAETKVVAARATFDSIAAVVEAVADTASSVPVSLVLPEIQACKDMRDAQLEQIDEMKVTIRDALADVELETRRADLAEQQLAPQFRQSHHALGFKTGLATGAAIVAAVIHFAR